MDPGTIIVEVTAIIGAVAAVIASINGIREWREHAQQPRQARPGPAATDPSPALPASEASPTPAGPLPAAAAPRRPSNLPTQLTPLIGREHELAGLEQLLRQPDVRLVTLTGQGGIGKTRLALRLGEGLLEQYADGVFLVTLASVTDPDLVAPTIAQVLDVREQGGQPLLDMLKSNLREKRMLLVLDNFEQVIEAAPVVSELLAAAPELKILVTSREVLRLNGEHAVAVAPLTLPDLGEQPPGADPAPSAAQYAAVRLFVERAQAADPAFVLTAENAPAVAEICYRLDGLPLAIELAAARVRLLSPPAMLKRLAPATGGSSLRLLTGGPRDLPARQQTLSSTIAWSYDLLDAEEQALFGCLGVFAGGWTLEAAEAVCGAGAGPATEALDGLDSLIAKSLVGKSGAGAEVRFSMLQTIREYALERLEQAGRAGAVRAAHAGWYLELTEQAEPQLYGAAQMAWLKRLEAEQDNLRAALRWALDCGQPEVALGLAANLAWFWNLRGRVSEGRGWLEAALANRESAPDGARARALLGLGELVSNQADWATAWATLDECISIARNVGDRRTLARALSSLSIFKVRGAQDARADTQPLADESLALARALGDPWTLGYVLTVLDIRSVLLGDEAPGSPLSQEALRCFQAAGDRWGTVLALRHLGMGAVARGDYAAAREAGEQGLAASRALGDRLGEAYTLNALGDVARIQGDYERAAACYEESLALDRELGLQADIPAMLHNLGYVALARGDISGARSLQEQSLALHRQAGNQAGMVEALNGLAAIAHSAGDPVRAARLYGAVEALRAAIGGPVWPAERVAYESEVSTLRGQLDEAALAHAWAEGRAMTLEQAVAAALETAPVSADAAGKRLQPISQSAAKTANDTRQDGQD